MNSPDDSSVLIAAFSLVVSIFGLIAACWAVCETNFTRESRENLDQAIKCLEWAHAALMGGESRARAPEASRNGWLTAARHIIRYYELRGSIHCETHRVACRIHHEHWRREFCVSLAQIGDNPKYYKCNSTDSNHWIFVDSAVMVHHFAADSELGLDPLDSPAAQYRIRKTPHNRAIDDHIGAWKDHRESLRDPPDDPDQ